MDKIKRRPKDCPDGERLIEGLTKVFYPEASSTVIFVIMALVLLVKPVGLFGRTA